MNTLNSSKSLMRFLVRIASNNNNNSNNRIIYILLSRNFFSSSICSLNQQHQQHQVQKQSAENHQNQPVLRNDHAGGQVSTHLSGVKKAKQTAKDVSYSLILLAGGMMVVATSYYLFTELFSRETPSGIYDESSKLCIENFEVRDALGTPIKVTAESGGRRVFQIKHKFYIEDGKLYLIINYYLEGQKNRGTVFCKVKRNDSTGKFEYEHIIVKLDHSHLGHNRITVKDAQQQNQPIKIN